MYALNMDTDHSARVRKSCVVEVVVLRRLFIANSRAKCDRRRDYDRRRQRSSSSSRGNIVQPNERSALLCSALLCVRSFVRVRRPGVVRVGPWHEAGGRGARGFCCCCCLNSLANYSPGVCDSCFAVVVVLVAGVIVSWCHKMLLAFLPFRERRLFADFSHLLPFLYPLLQFTHYTPGRALPFALIGSCPS